MADDQLCPECRVGKTANCTGWANPEHTLTCLTYVEKHGEVNRERDKAYPVVSDPAHPLHEDWLRIQVEKEALAQEIAAVRQERERLGRLAQPIEALRQMPTMLDLRIIALEQAVTVASQVQFSSITDLANNLYGFLKGDQA